LRGKSSTGRPVRQSDLGQRSPKKLLRAVVARLLGRKHYYASRPLKRGDFELSRSFSKARW
jgi:hypothetical protein